MPADAAVITALLLDRSMCLECIGRKTDLSTNEIDRYLTTIARRLELQRLTDRCRVCGDTGIVFSLHRG